MLAASFVGVNVALFGSASRAAPGGRDDSSVDVIRDLKMVDQFGQPFLLRQLRGKTVLMNFIFTGCGTTCPTQTSDLAEVQRSLPPPLARRVQFVSISVDPMADTPALLRRFAQSHGADLANWSFVSGRAEIITRVLRFYGAEPPAAAASPAHVTTLFLFDASGRGVQRYSGAIVDRARLSREIAEVDRLFNV